MRCHKQPMRLSARRQNVGAFLKRRKQQFLLLHTWLDVVFSQHEVRCRSSDRCKLEHKWEIGVKCIVSWPTKRHQKEGRERHDLLPSWYEGSQSNTLYRTTASLIPGLKQVCGIWWFVHLSSIGLVPQCCKRWLWILPHGTLPRGSSDSARNARSESLQASQRRGLNLRSTPWLRQQVSAMVKVSTGTGNACLCDCGKNFNGVGCELRRAVVQISFVGENEKTEATPRSDRRCR